MIPLLAGHPGMPGAIVDGPEEMRARPCASSSAGRRLIKIATSGGVLSPRDNPRHGHFRDDELAALAPRPTRPACR